MNEYQQSHVTTTLDDYLDEDNSSSNTSGSNSSGGQDIKEEQKPKLSKSEQELYDYENPIEAHQRKELESSHRVNTDERLRDDISQSSSDEDS